MFMVTWFFGTLRQYPEIAIFLTLALGYYFGKFTFKGIGLGSVTATLLAGVLIGQIGITISQPLKAFVFLMFLFAVGYGVGPQFVRGVAKDGLPQAFFAVVQCVFCLLVPFAIAKVAGYDMGYAAGLYSGSQTISAAMGLSTDAINRLGLAADQAKGLLNSMPIAYAVTYLFGTVGSALVIALVGPALLRIDLVAACKDYEEKQGGGTKQLGGPGTAWHRWEVRAFRVQPGGKASGLRAIEAEALVPDARVFVLRIRHNGTIEDATADTLLSEGDVVALAGARDVLLKIVGEGAKEVEDPELLSLPVEGVDTLVTNKSVDGKTLAELAQLPAARGVFLRKITRGATATDIPILPNTELYRGDVVTLVGRTQDTTAAAKLLYRCRDHSRRGSRGAGFENWRSAADPLNCRWRAYRGSRVRLAPLGTPILRADPISYRLVHEFCWSQYFHRNRRDFGRPGLRQRPQDAGCQLVPVGGFGDHIAADSWPVRR
jgi:putative transport protein